jgi:F0F1-type ATP synthase epsilon subunit
MGVLANHVPSIEQLKPGLIEVIEESGGSKQFFRRHIAFAGIALLLTEYMQFPGALQLSNQTRN